MVGSMAEHARSSPSVEDRLFVDNLGLVLAFSKQYGMFDADYLQERTIDLWRAMRAYDQSQGCAFSTLAFTYMRLGSQRDWHHGRREKRGGKIRHVSLEQLLDGLGLANVEDDDEAEGF